MLYILLMSHFFPFPVYYKFFFWMDVEFSQINFLSLMRYHGVSLLLYVHVMWLIDLSIHFFLLKRFYCFILFIPSFWTWFVILLRVFLSVSTSEVGLSFFLLVLSLSMSYCKRSRNTFMNALFLHLEMVYAWCIWSLNIS